MCENKATAYCADTCKLRPVRAASPPISRSCPSAHIEQEHQNLPAGCCEVVSVVIVVVVAPACSNCGADVRHLALHRARRTHCGKRPHSAAQSTIMNVTHAVPTPSYCVLIHAILAAPGKVLLVGRSRGPRHPAASIQDGSTLPIAIRRGAGVRAATDEGRPAASPPKHKRASPGPVGAVHVTTHTA